MKFIRKSVSILMAIIMIVSLFTMIPFEASAAGSVEYIYRWWNEETRQVESEPRFCTDYISTNQNSLPNRLEAGWYVVDKDFNVSYGNKMSATGGGEINLIICDGVTFKPESGIAVSQNTTLNIYSQTNDSGKLSVDFGTKPKENHNQSDAVIGGTRYEPNSGDINIYGGTLNLDSGDATWGSNGACIGGAEHGSAGTVSVYGGSLKLHSSSGACIGGGKGGGIGGTGSGNSDAAIRIYGGTIEAESWWGGAPIGTGENYPGAMGSIEIYGGNTTVKGHNGVAGIGGGENSSNPSIDIYGGKIAACAMDSKYTGAGIGSGKKEHQRAPIHIHGGTIVSTSQTGAGIGSGYGGDAGEIRISGASVVSSSTAGGAGIGGGKRGDDEGGFGGSINISSGSHVVATSSSCKKNQDFIDRLNKSIDNSGMKGDATTYANSAVVLISWLIELFDVEISGAGIGGGYNGGAGLITISDSTVLAESGAYAAGIGSGDEATRRCVINIKDGSVVSATAGTDAAGIGTGNENDVTPVINISDSTVTANGGAYGAGIGGGDDVSGGTITISNSKVTAGTNTDAAGIGGGEGGNGGKIKILDGSVVTAVGGAYGAGIGGGDHADGGTTTIDNSTVKAYGGTDAAGIGGGEDGDGGHVEIINGSNVYAEGKDYGAGIGGGEDASGDYCQINNSCTVKAVSGGDGNVQSIGHGDCGWYVSSYTGGEISLGNREIVKVGSDVYRGNDRFSAIWNHKEVTVSPCEHTNTEWRMVNEYRHCKYCKDCGAELTSTKEYHKWDDNNICTVCGGEQIDVSLTLKEENNSGPVNITIQNKLNGYYVLPECGNIPDGKEFAYWYDEIDGTDYYPGESYRLVYRNNNIKAVYFDLTDADYIDENGHEQTVKARVLNKGEGYLYLSDGWYIVTEDIGVGWTLYICGDVHLILADGKTLYLNEEIPGLGVGMRGRKTDNSYSKLTIYGQNNQTGAFNLQDRRNSLTAFSQYGGNVSGAKMGGTARMSRKYYTITKGSFDLDARFSAAPDGIINFTGGNIYIKDVWMEEGVTLTLGWTHRTDSIKLDKIDYYENATVKVADGQALTDGTNVYSGTLTDNQLNAINGKTLTPYIHNYSEPEWVWDSDYTNATAVFRCSDCDDVQEIKAKVTYTDSGKTRTSTARCSFLGVEYTTTQTKQIIFDVKIANTAHGSVTANKATAKKDDNVRLTLTPDDGYITKGFTVVPEDGTQEIEMDEKYFTMPACNVTVKANFAPITPRTEPYIDDEGEYHLGNVAYYEEDGKYYAVDEDGTIGEYLDSIELSYFDFAFINNDSEYQINYYTGPTDISELVIPKTYNGKPVTVLGVDNNDTFINYGENSKTQFDLVLNENIREIKNRSFYTMWVKKVTGDTSGLKKIGAYAFSWANSPDGYKLDIKLDYEGEIDVDTKIFNNMNVTMRLKHATTFDSNSFGQQSISYIFADAHSYGEPVWKWSSDNSSATATFTCTNSRCKHTETVDATVTESDELTKTVYTASAEFGGNTYTATESVDKTHSSITIKAAAHGVVTAGKDSAYTGEPVTLTATPESGYNLESISVKDALDNEIKVTENTFIMPDSEVTVTPVFGHKRYAVNYNDPDGGWVSGPMYADEGDTVTVKAIPVSGYELAYLSLRDNAGAFTRIEDNTFTMPAYEVKVFATFKKADLSITYVSDGHGTVTGADTAQFNDHVPLTIIPDEGYAATNIYAEDDEWHEYANIIDNELYMSDGDVTVYAEFVPITPAKEPYIDESGEYHLGNIEHCEIDGYYFAVENGIVGSSLDSVEVSYFDFTDNGDSYQINYYTGPTEKLTELVIPKTYNGKPVTVLGTDNRSAFIENSNPKPQFTLTLNENIEEIKGYAFYTMWVKKVRGDTSNLGKLGDYAFSWANSPNGYTLDIKLDYEGIISAGRGVFNNMTVTARLKHATAFNRSSFMQKSITYVITDDAHSYGNPVWIWADDYSSASAQFTCTDPRCKHEETADAEIISEYENGAPEYIAAAIFEGKEYTNVKALENPLDASYSPEITAATARENDGNLFSLSDSLVYTKARLLGVQKKEAIKTDTAGSGLRFVAELSSEFVGKDNIDYGFEIVKTSKNNTAGFAGATPTGGFDIMQNLINENSGNIKSISCKNTSNNITGDARYGDSSADTAYKYVTLAINDIPDTQGVAVRFYVEIDGAKYYSAYTNSNGEAFRGCCASYETLENAVR